ncbi:hypothetical protein C0J52_09190 [Blattella germanica]|nr:hypothetical protein C0J52_09190 [Blattella germanica]
MDTCRQRLRRTTSLVACLLLVLVLASEVSDAHAAKLRHKRRNHSVRAVSSTFTTSRRLTRLGRSISLPEAENCTACAFKVEVDVVENRMPRAITQVRCVQEGGPCKTAENRGLWSLQIDVGPTIGCFCFTRNDCVEQVQPAFCNSTFQCDETQRMKNYWLDRVYKVIIYF